MSRNGGPQKYGAVCFVVFFFCSTHTVVLPTNDTRCNLPAARTRQKHSPMSVSVFPEPFMVKQGHPKANWVFRPSSLSGREMMGGFQRGPTYVTEAIKRQKLSFFVWHPPTIPTLPGESSPDLDCMVPQYSLGSTRLPGVDEAFSLVIHLQHQVVSACCPSSEKKDVCKKRIITARQLTSKTCFVEARGGNRLIFC